MDDIILSINVLKDGRVAVFENGQLILGLLKVNFSAEPNKPPVFSISKILNKEENYGS